MDAKIVIVGEAPGEMEERLRRPFVGPAGVLLDKLLHFSGIQRTQCYVTNTVKERPPNNDIERFIKFPSRGIPVETEAFQIYVQSLKAELERLKPNLIIAAGRVPLWALTRKLGITNWRGSVIESTLLPGVKVMPAIHPAAALREIKYQHFIAFDFGRARLEAQTPDLPKDEHTYHIAPSFEEALGFLDYCMNVGMVGADIEVSGRDVSCISFAPSADEVMSIPFLAGGKFYFTPPQEMVVWQKIGQLMSDRRITKIFQNAVFDTTFLCREYHVICRNLEDTMIAQAILYPEFPKGLAFITSIYTNMPYYKDEGKAHFLLNPKAKLNSTDEQFWIYNAKDSLVLMEAFPKQVEELIKRGNMEAYENQRNLIEPILFMTERGLRVDVEAKQKASDRAAKKMVETQDILNKLTGTALNSNSPKQVSEYFYKVKRVKPYLKKGRPTVDEKALLRLQRAGHPEAQAILLFRKYSKFRGTYAEMELDPDGRMRSSINPVGTKFGRLSTSKNIYGTGMNMQNLPPEAKALLIPDEGYIAYNVDLAQAENRVVAYLGPDAEMMRAFEEGLDLHSLTASKIFGIPYDEIIAMDKAGVKSELGNGEYTHRFWGKKANHALNYDFGIQSFALLYQLSDADARFIVDAYHRGYPGVRKYHAMTQNTLQNKGKVLVNLHGRRFRFTDRWGDHLFKEAYSFVPQSTVADCMNRWGLVHAYQRQDLYKPVEILMQIHDSMLYQVPLTTSWYEQARIIMEMKSSLEQPLEYNGRSFHLPADFKMHDKNFFKGVEFKAATLDELDTAGLATLLQQTYEASS